MQSRHAKGQSSGAAAGADGGGTGGDEDEEAEERRFVVDDDDDADGEAAHSAAAAAPTVGLPGSASLRVPRSALARPLASSGVGESGALFRVDGTGLCEGGGDARAASTAAASACGRNTNWPDTVRRTVLHGRSCRVVELACVGGDGGVLGFLDLRRGEAAVGGEDGAAAVGAAGAADGDGAARLRGGPG